MSFIYTSGLSAQFQYSSGRQARFLRSLTIELGFSGWCREGALKLLVSSLFPLNINVLSLTRRLYLPSLGHAVERVTSFAYSVIPLLPTHFNNASRSRRTAVYILQYAITYKTVIAALCKGFKFRGVSFQWKHIMFYSWRHGLLPFIGASWPWHVNLTRQR